MHPWSALLSLQSRYSQPSLRSHVSRESLGSRESYVIHPAACPLPDSSGDSNPCSTPMTGHPTIHRLALLFTAHKCTVINANSSEEQRSCVPHSSLVTRFRLRSTNSTSKIIWWTTYVVLHWHPATLLALAKENNSGGFCSKKSHTS